MSTSCYIFVYAINILQCIFVLGLGHYASKSGLLRYGPDCHGGLFSPQLVLLHSQLPTSSRLMKLSNSLKQWRDRAGLSFWETSTTAQPPQVFTGKFRPALVWWLPEACSVWMPCGVASVPTVTITFSLVGHFLICWLTTSTCLQVEHLLSFVLRY